MHGLPGMPGCAPAPTAPGGLLPRRYAARWSIERTVPFALLTCTLVIAWYARHGHSPAHITARRRAQPWYPAKTEPAFEDMLTQLRRVLITAAFPGVPRHAPHPSKPELSWQHGKQPPHNCETSVTRSVHAFRDCQLNAGG